MVCTASTAARLVAASRRSQRSQRRNSASDAKKSTAKAIANTVGLPPQTTKRWGSSTAKEKVSAASSAAPRLARARATA